MTQQDILESLSLTSDERIALEKQTWRQCNSSQWHEERRRRIAGSKCGRISSKKKKLYHFFNFVCTLSLSLIFRNPFCGVKKMKQLHVKRMLSTCTPMGILV